MKLTALLADAVAVADAQLYVHGGGWHLVPSSRLPAVLPNLGVGIVIDLTPGELAEPHQFALRIRDADGRLVPLVRGKSDDYQNTEGSDEITAELSAAPPVTEAVAVTLVLAFNIQQVTLGQAGLYELEIAIDDEVRERLRLEVQLAQPDTG